MRPSLPILAGLLIAGMTLPLQAETAPIKGAVQGTAQAGKGIVKGTAQAGKGVVKGGGTAVKQTGKGLWCIVTLGNRC
ncbi:MAG: hypothetical protein ACREDO_03075 [Methyloceanibacter sp.]